MSKVFIWDYVGKVTTNWHSGGGVVVIAESEEEAKSTLFSSMDKGAEPDFSSAKLTIYELMDNEEPKAFIFPDAGCC